MKKRFEEIEHTADLAIRVWGSDLTALFANAAFGMGCLLSEGPEEPLTVSQMIELVAVDTETLLVDWLSELLFLGEQLDVVFTRFEELHVSGNHLAGIARGGPTRERRSAIKAVTFADLEITETDRGLETDIVFDV